MLFPKTETGVYILYEYSKLSGTQTGEIKGKRLH